MSHLDEGTIHAWLDGALPADEAAGVEAHARECAECAAMVAEARGFMAGASRIVSSLDVVPGNVIPATPKPTPTARGSLWRRLKLTPARAAIAATILVGVASMLSVRHRNFESAVRNEIGAKAAAPMTERAVAPTAPSAAGGASASSSASSPASASAPAPPPATRQASPPAPALAPAGVPSIPPSAPTDTVAAVREAKPAAGADRRDLAAQKAVAENVVATATAGRAAESVQLNQAARRYAPAAAGAAPRAAMTADRVIRPEGCYAIDEPPAGLDLRGLPARFELARDSSNAGVVRAIELTGGAGRPVDGASWLVQAAGMVVITLKGAEASAPLELRFLLGDTTLRVAEGGRESTMRVTRVGCGG